MYSIREMENRINDIDTLKRLVAESEKALGLYPQDIELLRPDYLYEYVELLGRLWETI